MQITEKWLKEQNACKDGYKWALKILDDKSMPSADFVKTLVADKKYDWASWIFEKSFTKKQSVQYAIFAAERVINIFEEKYPNAPRARQALEAAKKVLENDTTENRAAAWAARRAAAEAAAAATEAAARAAAWAAAAAAEAAWAAAAAAEAAAAATEAAARAAAWAAAEAAEAAMKIKIIEYGVELLVGKT